MIFTCTVHSALLSDGLQFVSMSVFVVLNWVPVEFFDGPIHFH